MPKLRSWIVRWSCAVVLVLAAGCGPRGHAEGPGGALAQALGGPSLRITMLDVKQGDGILLELPDETLILVDAGPRDVLLLNPLVRYFLQRGRDHLDYVLVSHPHDDHYFGLSSSKARGSLRPGTCRRFITTTSPDYNLPDIPRQNRKFTNFLKGMETFCAATEQLRVDGGGPMDLTPRVYPNPAPGAAPFKLELLQSDPFRAGNPGQSGGHALANNASMILRLTYGAFSMLFMGDAEGPAERKLLDDYEPQNGKPDPLRSTVLKIGHHGSCSSTSNELLARVAPALSMISSGNRHGHPHCQTINRLAALPNATSLPRPYVRTDLNGSITLLVDGSVDPGGNAAFTVAPEQKPALPRSYDACDTDNQPHTDDCIDF